MTIRGTKRLRPHPTGGRSRGFTLIELMIVVAIMLVISAMAMPNIMNAIDDVRLHGAMRDVIGVMQQARQRAIRDNAYYQMANQGNIVFADLNNDGAFQSGGATPEPAIQMPYTITLGNAGAPAFNNALAGPNFNPTMNAPPAFNSRGIPCIIAAGNCVTRAGGMVAGQPGANISFLFFFTQTRTFGANAWSAITVTSAGRMRAWYYEPRTNTWSN